MFEKVSWHLALILIVVFAGFVFLVFSPMLNSFFDPQDFISFLNPLRAEKPVVQYMVESWSWINNEGEFIGFFRPLTNVTFMLEYPLFGHNPLGYKLVNLGIHLLCAFLIARLAMLLSRRKWLAVFTAMLFTVHPGTVVAIGWIAARCDILATLFSVMALSSTFLLSRNSEVTWKAVTPAIFVLLAVSSKELGMANFIALPIMYFLWPGRKKRKRNTLYFTGSLVIVAVVYLLVRQMIFGDIGGYGVYARLTAIPRDVAILVSQATGSLFLRLHIFRYLLYLFVGYVIVNYARGELHKWREVGVAILVTGAYSYQSIIGDVCTHYVYVASVFTVLFLVYFAGRIEIPGREGRHFLTGIALLVLLAAGYSTRHECQDFRNKYVNCRRIFTALEEISDLLPSESGAVCIIQATGNTPIERAMKIVTIYMGYIDTDSECTYLVSREVINESDLPILVWENDRIVIK